MPKPTAAIDYERCRPGRCEKGICVAVPACPTETLRQDTAYEVPTPVGPCRGCGVCVAACPLKAIRMV